VNPFFSIITVCLNSEKTIETTIKSVTEQSFTDFEYIIIDGKSSDKTLEIIEKYNCNTYVTSPIAKNYIDEKEFEKNKIKVEWYEYSQKLNRLSIIDYLFNN